jgi:L-threonylcarbamoyladenylate synthase
MPTDTIYGIVGRAEDKGVVERIYQARQRAPEKPCIILIGDIAELEKFSIKLSKEQKSKLKEFWPGPVSIVLDCLDDKFSYLHRGTKGLAFRLPKDENLRNLLTHTGPLVAPSANREGAPPAQNIAEAKNYFGDKVEMYADGGTIQGSPSRLIKFNPQGGVVVLRGQS